MSFSETEASSSYPHFAKKNQKKQSSVELVEKLGVSTLKCLSCFKESFIFHVRKEVFATSAVVGESI